LASGVALAKTITSTNANDILMGTRNADSIDAKDGDDVVRARPGSDAIWGGDGSDRLYGGKGRDHIYTGGWYKDFVDCGPGIDRVEVDSSDTVRNCERVVDVTPPDRF